jgi:hypothetical protein
MNCRVLFLAISLAVGLSACGGGGGSPGVSSGEVVVPTTPAKPTMSLSLVDSTGKELTARNLSQTQPQFLRVGLKNAAGAVVPNSRVTIGLESAIAVLVPATGQLTDSNGFVQFKISPASVTSAGVVLVTAAAAVSGEPLTQSMDLQISSGTVELSALSIAPSSVQKGQSVNVSLSVAVNGATASSNSVSVEFTSSCGVATPEQSVVDSTGRASAVIQTATQGDCIVSATAAGKTMAGNYVVTAPPITGLQFVGASPSVIYQQGSPGVNTSQVTFKVIDSTGNPVSGVAVDASLTNLDGGINFCGSPATATSNGDGLLVFSVCGGTLPATVQVRAAIANIPAKYTDSNILTIQTGLPTQRFFDISASRFNIWVGGYFTNRFNGNKTSISVFAADRQGNPVPDGTPITLVAEGGQLNSAGLSSCIVSAGRCSVDLVGQDYRPMGSGASGGEPRPGRVTVLAFADGEEYFIDANFNNRYDDGELFEDLGVPYLDKDESLDFAASYRNLVTLTDEGEVTYPIPAAAMGTKGCPTNSNIGLSVANTCNGKWDRLTKVRRSIVIVFSGNTIGDPSFYHDSIPVDKRTKTIASSKTGITVQLADGNGNPLPAGSPVAVEVQKVNPDGECAAKLFGSAVPNTTEPSWHSVSLEKCDSGDTILFTVLVEDIKSGYAVKVP